MHHRSVVDPDQGQDQPHRTGDLPFHFSGFRCVAPQVPDTIAPEKSPTDSVPDPVAWHHFRSSPISQPASPSQRTVCLLGNRLGVSAISPSGSVLFRLAQLFQVRLRTRGAGLVPAGTTQEWAPTKALPLTSLVTGSGGEGFKGRCEFLRSILLPEDSSLPVREWRFAGATGGASRNRFRGW